MGNLNFYLLSTWRRQRNKGEDLKEVFEDTAQNRDTLKVGIEMLIQKGLYRVDTEHSHQ